MALNFDAASLAYMYWCFSTVVVLNLFKKAHALACIFYRFQRWEEMVEVFEIFRAEDKYLFNPE